MLVWPGRALADVVGRAEVVSRRERGTCGAQDDHPDRVVGLGELERNAQFDEQSAGLCVALFRAIQGDHGDPAIVDRLVADVFEVLHAIRPGTLSIGPAIDRTDPADTHDRSFTAHERMT